MNEALVVQRVTHIAAPPAAVFAFLNDPEKILRWMGTDATTERRIRAGSTSSKASAGETTLAAPSARSCGPSSRLQLRLGGQRGRSAGIEPGRDRPDRPERLHALAHDAYRAARRRTMRLSRERMGPLPRQAGRRRRRRRSRARSWPPAPVRGGVRRSMEAIRHRPRRRRNSVEQKDDCAVQRAPYMRLDRRREVSPLDESVSARSARLMNASEAALDPLGRWRRSSRKQAVRAFQRSPRGSITQPSQSRGIFEITFQQPLNGIVYTAEKKLPPHRGVMQFPVDCLAGDRPDAPSPHSPIAVFRMIRSVDRLDGRGQMCSIFVQFNPPT